MAVLKRRYVIISIIAILVIAIVLSSFAYLNVQKSNSGTIANLSLGGLPYEYQTLVDVAQNQHYFAENNINLTMSSYPSGPAAMTALSSNAVDVCVAADYAFVEGVIQKQNITVIASVDQGEFVSLLIRNDSGIKSPSDLAGHRVGLTLGTIEEFYLDQYLELQGLNLSNVTVVNVSNAQDAVAAITNGTVDALVTTQLIAAQVQSQMGNNVFAWNVQGNQLSIMLLICRSQWVVQNNDIVVRFLKALSKAENYVINNPSSAHAIVNSQLNTTISQTEWSNNRFSLQLGQSLILTLDYQGQFLISNNLTKATTVPNFTNYIYTQGLESVDPDYVNIIG